MVNNVMGNTGAPIKAHAIMYNMVVQAVLLYGSKTWVVIDEMVTVPEVFHNRISRRIEGMTERKGVGRERDWASVDAALETMGIWSIREYVPRQN